MNKIESIIKKELKYAVFPMVCADHCAWLAEIDFASAVNDADILTEITVNACKQYGYDAVFLFSDAYVEAQAMGCPVRLSPFPIITGPMGGERIDRTHIIIDAARKIKEQIELPLFVSIKGPFSLAAFLCGLKDFMKLIPKHKDQAKNYLDIAMNFQMQYLDRLADLDVNIMIGDPVASASVISPETFTDFALKPLHSMIEKIKSFHKVAALHICGDTIPIIEHLDRLGADLLSIEDVNVPTTTTKMGGIATNTIMYGSISSINAEIEKALANDYLIVSTSCDVPIRTPPENIKALVNIIRDKTANK